MLNLYTAIGNSETWARNEQAGNRFKSMLAEVGTVSVEGEPITTLSWQRLANQVRARKVLTLGTNLKNEQIVVTRNFKPAVTESLRLIKGLDVHTNGTAVQLRAQRALLEQIPVLKERKKEW